jgi:CPA1 family monovalent cation:H+ antiporter
MNAFSLISIITLVCAGFSYINVRFLKLPHTIGLMIVALVCSIAIIIEGNINNYVHDILLQFVLKVNFSEALLDVMLSFLLFAGALDVNIKDLKEQRAAIIPFSTLSVAVSTFLFGSIMYYFLNLFNLKIDFTYCLLFGAMVSPTDPIAVLGILKQMKFPKSLSATIGGESLFNDGIGVVFFVTLLSVVNKGVENFSAVETVILFLREVAGGILLGLILGWIVTQLIKGIAHYQTEVLLSLAFVMMTSVVARQIHVSGPLAVIILGLMIGNTPGRKAMTEEAWNYHHKFWELIDSFLNAFLFVMIGLQLLRFPFLFSYFGYGLFAIFILLLCRYISLFIPILFIRNKELYNTRSALIMTWGGLRGGLSVALTMALPESEFKNVIVSITYIIVVFSIIVQGLSTQKLINSLGYNR